MNEQLNPIFKGLLNPHAPQLDDTIEETGCEKTEDVKEQEREEEGDSNV